MIFFPFYVERWTMSAQGLTAQQEGIYLRLVLWMYANESHLPADRNECVRIARIAGQSAGHTRDSAGQSGTEVADVALVLQRFFTRTEQGFAQKKAIAEIQKFQLGEPQRNARRDMDTARKRQAREDQRRLYGMCRERGIETRPGMRLNDLRTLLGIPLPTNNVVPLSRGLSAADMRTNPQAVTADGAGDTSLSVPEFHNPRTMNHSVPKGTHDVSAQDADSEGAPRVAGEQGIEHVPQGAAVPVERIATAVKALRTGGLVGINGSHPMLLELLRAGASDETLTWAAAAAAAKGKPFAYAIAIVEGQMREAAASAAGGLTAPAERNRVSEWAPGLEARR
jgi:uncharacterized protein YdaU (DUF1376 family)